jgi:hypothetical protein
MTSQLRISVWIAIFTCAFLPQRATASADLDKLYTMRNIIAVVVDMDKEPINGDGVENELVKVLRSKSQFNFVDEAYIQLKDTIKSMDGQDFHGTSGAERLKQIFPLVRQISHSGVDAVVFAEVYPTEEKYLIALTFVNAAETEIIATYEQVVDDPLRIPSFAAATRLAIDELLKRLPFDGSILSREGYRVVLDRGKADFRPGMEIPVFTVEKDKKIPKPHLEETGLLVINQVEDNLSFGKITVERLPREVAAGNKFIIPSNPNYRKLTGELEENKKIVPYTREYGFLDARVGFSTLTMGQTPQDGSPAQSNGIFYPTLDLTGQIWLTSSFFLEGDLTAAAWSIDSVQGTQPHTLSTGMGDLRLVGGYRWLVFGSLGRPTVNFRLGYGRHEFLVDAPNNGYQFENDFYSGILASVGISVPFTQKVSMDLDLSSFLFPGFSEAPLTSGANVTGVSVFEMSLKASYLLTPECNLDARLRYLGAGAGFSGQGTSPNALASVSESVTALTLGASYFF